MVPGDGGGFLGLLPLVLRWFCRIMIWSGIAAMPVAATGNPAVEQNEAVFSYGPGPVEIFIFSDYFCPPCQEIEPYLSEALPELLPQGVRVTFVDMPFSRLTLLYSKYFLYAAKASQDLEELLHARGVLTDMAKADEVKSDQDMVSALRDAEVRIRFFDIRPLFARWAEIIREYNVRSTPTCIVVKPGSESQSYVGGHKIREALESLLETPEEACP